MLIESVILFFSHNYNSEYIFCYIYKSKNCKLATYHVSSSLHHQFSSTQAAVELALGPPIQRQEAKPPVALDVHGLHRSSTVRACPRCRLPRQHPFLFITHEHQTHDRIPFFLLPLTSSLSRVSGFACSSACLPFFPVLGCCFEICSK